MYIFVIQTEFRPSAADILSNPELKKYIKRCESPKQSQKSADNLKEQQHKLAKREEALRAKELALEKREKEILGKPRAIYVLPFLSKVSLSHIRRVISYNQET